MATIFARATKAEDAVAAITDAIVRGNLAPGTKLQVQQMAARFGVGPTPLREALSRLVPQGLVTAEGQRGFRVAPTSRADLEDLVGTRIVVETGALRLAMRTGGSEWEAGIVAALHRLKRLTENDSADAEEFAELNGQFHAAMLGACRSVRLIALFDSLYAQMRRYRAILVTGITNAADVYEEHYALAQHVLNHQVDRAVDALTEHLQGQIRHCHEPMAL